MSSEVSSEGVQARNGLQSLLRWLPGIVITLLAIALLAKTVPWSEFVHALTSIPLWFFAILVLLYLLTLLLRGVVWQLLLQRRVTVGAAFLAINEGYFFNNVLPFRLGELARAFLLGRRSRLGLFHVLPTIVVERSYDLIISAGLLLITLPLALKLDWARPAALIVLFGILAGLSLLYLGARQRAWVEARMDQLGSRWGWMRRWVLPQLHAILDGFSVFTRFEYFAGSFGLLFLTWMIGLFRDWLLIRLFVPDAPLWWAALSISAAHLVGAVPSVMASLGTFELGAVEALTLVGMSRGPALAYILVVHVIHLIFSSLIGAYGLSQEGQTFTELYAEIRRAR